jgi:hypothetical protein
MKTIIIDGVEYVPVIKEETTQPMVPDEWQVYSG